MPDTENEVELIVSYIFILSSIKKSINKSVCKYSKLFLALDKS